MTKNKDCVCRHGELDHSPVLKHPPKVNFGLFKFPATWGDIPTWYRMNCRKCDCDEYNGSQEPWDSFIDPKEKSKG